MIYDVALGQTVRRPYQGCLEIPLHKTETQRQDANRGEIVRNRARELLFAADLPNLILLQALYPFLKLKRSGYSLVWRAKGKTLWSTWNPESQLKRFTLSNVWDEHNKAEAREMSASAEWLVEQTRRTLTKAIRDRDTMTLAAHLQAGGELLPRPEVIVRSDLAAGRTDVTKSKFQVIYPELCKVTEVFLDVRNSKEEIISMVSQLESPIAQMERLNVNRGGYSR